MVLDTLLGVEELAQLTIQDLVVDNPSFSVHDDCPSLQVLNPGADLQASRFVVHVLKEGGEGVIVYSVLVVLAMLGDGLLPKFETNLQNLLQKRVT